MNATQSRPIAAAAALFIFCCLLAACGGNPFQLVPTQASTLVRLYSSTTGTGPNATLQNGGIVVFFGSESFMADPSGMLYVFPTPLADGTVQAPMTAYFAYPPPTSVLPLANTAPSIFPVPFQLQGSLSSSSFSGSYGPPNSGTLNAATPFAVNAQTIQTTSLDSLSGSYSGFYFGPSIPSVTLSLTLDQSGNLTGSDSQGCQYTGQLQPQNSGLFSATLDSACFGQQSGVAVYSSQGYWESMFVPDNPNPPGTYLDVFVNNSGYGFAMEWTHQ